MLIIFLIISVFLLLNNNRFKPSSQEIKSINAGIKDISLKESITKDKNLLKSYNTINTLDSENTIKYFIKAYNISNLEAIKYLKPIPDFLRFDYYDINVLNSYKETSKENIAIEATKARIYKNYYIYNLIKNIKLNNPTLKIIDNGENYKIYSAEIEYTDLTKNTKDISELLYKEENTAEFLKFLKEIKHKDKKTVNIYVIKDSGLGYRIDLSNKINYDLISVLSGNLSKFTLK